MKKVILFFIATVISIASFAQNTWKVDPMHSFVGFQVKHSGISLVKGDFNKFEGTFTNTKPDFTDVKISFVVDVNSISTNVEMRDNHLKSNDFFAAEKFPKMTFESTSFEKMSGSKVSKKGSKKTNDSVYLLKGKLTIKDITKDVEFKVAYGGESKDQQGNTKTGFLAKTKINRIDYNINYDPTGAAIGKDINIELNLQFSKVK